MTAIRCIFKAGQLVALFLAGLAGGTVAVAQTGGIIPIVIVQATQSVATTNTPGVFTVYRAGNTNLTLNVWYDLTGTASNGVDYKLIPPHWVTIEAGVVSNIVAITPLINPPSGTVAKTVVLTLTNSPLMMPVNYEIGSPSRAVVYVEANGATNLPPKVDILKPADGAVFYTPTNIQMLAKAGDSDGFISGVEFFAGETNLGPGIPVVLDPPGINGVTGLVYLFNWLNPSPGKYPLTAVATDNGGASTTSDPVNISVLLGPPTNVPPVVRIISPPNGAIFFAPVNIPLYAYAKDFDGAVTSVEFFANGNSLGFAQPLPAPLTASDGSGTLPPVYPTNIFFLIWSNVSAGGYALTAKATDNDGGSTISDPVKLEVLPSPPPPTNHPPIVSIVASDPVAVEGTNCWVWTGETNSTPTWAAWPAAVCQCFTNRGPKTATFTVRRDGDTNADLTVPYDIGGTASNGVDYVMLSGTVTIPSGERRAFITIVPIDDGPPDVNKTVILTLLPDMRMSPLPGYVLGCPSRAAAIIIDGICPRPATAALSERCFHLTAPGPDAAWFCIEYSSDLVHWTTICTNQVVNGSVDFVDPDAAGISGRFYRVVPLTDAPTN